MINYLKESFYYYLGTTSYFIGKIFYNLANWAYRKFEDEYMNGDLDV